MFPGPGPAPTGAPGHVPQPGRTPGYRIGEGAKTGEAGFINVNERLFAPLQGLDENDVLQGGYGWLDLTDGGRTYHPGVDLNSGGSCNADAGLLVVAPLAAVVRAVLPWDGVTPGEGNHVWLEVDDPLAPAPTWVHFDHLMAFHCREGQRLEAGGAVGQCGSTAFWACAHLHTELLPHAPGDGWWQWPFRWPKEAVEAAYYEPRAWWEAASAKVAGAPPEVVTMLLEGWQLKGWVLADLYQQAGVPYNPESATASAWCDELHRGVYRGRPRGEEHQIEDGVWQEYESGVVVWKASTGAVSWNG
jgi:murein DD-endopeptidase MepM/ murein hydrolase activator NlpD